MLSNLRPLVIAAMFTACDPGPPAGAEVKVVADVKAGAEAKASPQVKAEAQVGPAVAGVRAVAGEVVALKPVVEVEAALGRKIALNAADLDLGAVVRLLIAGELVGAAELELLLNAPGEASHRIDLDVDGTRDYVQVVEVRAAGAATLELRAIPSSRPEAALAVLVGTITRARLEAEGQLRVSASYAAAVAGGADFHLDERVAADGRVKLAADAPAAMSAWWAVQPGAPVYVSTHVSAADIQAAADGGVHFVGDAAVRLTAAQLVALRGALKLEVGAVVAAGAPRAGEAAAAVKAGAKQAAKVEAGVKHGAKAGAGVHVGGGAGVHVGGGGVKVGGGISVGGGVSVGGGAKGGVKIGK